MCGRFGLTREQREVAGEFADLNVKIHVPPTEPRYNIAPSQDILAVRRSEGDVTAQLLRWGIDVPWAKPGERSRELINLRAETALRGGLFGKLLDSRRIAIPASHFYEWRKGVSGSRTPMVIGPAKPELFVLAGLEGDWADRETGEIMRAAVILTTQPNGVMGKIHNRMPVILPRSSLARWLDPEQKGVDVADLLAPCPDDWLLVSQASPKVNNPRNEGPELLLGDDHL
ncbi:MAG: SOS response-associated peptidase [Acidimicrobiaceae bacterium]|nr:SOS response-associated peptidase [Acidimicrobiaceae bacterium]